MTTFDQKALFGGAITADLPSGFLDVSDIRQVPDHQEVYLDVNGLTSIVIDITERVDQSTAATDAAALEYHYKDAFSDPDETTKTWSSGTVMFSKMPKVPAYSVFASQQPIPDPQARRPKPDFTAIMILMLRLVEQKTDIIISINVPHVPGEYKPEDIDLPSQKLGKLLTEASNYRQRILETFEIKDWGLFVNEEQGILS